MLLKTAAETYQFGFLRNVITGAYPAAALRRVVGPLARHSPAARRLIDRAEPVPDALITQARTAELVYQTGVRLQGLNSTIASMLQYHGFRLYSRLAASRVTELGGGPGIYHFRSGFGGRSVKVAADRGWVTLCDHSIAHPNSFERLAGNYGAELRRSPYWRLVLDDLAAATHVVVNSDFVRDTLVEEGLDEGRIHILYWGIDDEFLAGGEAHVQDPSDSTPTLLFAGALSQRKGIDVLADAVAALPTEGWRLRLTGPAMSDGTDAVDKLLSCEQVSWLGNLRRADLAREMRAADVFVFPTLIEGSARVVFEALASGCYVITTARAGSVVGQGATGAIVAAGDARELAAAMADAIAASEQVQAAGRANAAFVRRNYTQATYASGLFELYRGLSQ